MDSTPCTIILFGATGDLAMKKLIPALYSLDRKGNMHEETKIIAIGRRDFTDETMRKEYHGIVSTKESSGKRFLSRILYHKIQFDEGAGYDLLAQRIGPLSKNRLLYLAVPQASVPTIIGHLSRTGIVKRSPEGEWHRVVFEKPFGSDLKSARMLNADITKYFDEEQVFRIDHYLGKLFVQELMLLRFANPLFENNWRREYIENVQIIVTETVGVGSRADYYDNSGAIRDMLQNHLMQLLALVAMEPPKKTHAEAIRDEKVKVLRSIARPNRWSLQKDVVIGQYGGGTIEGQPTQGYRSEESIRPDSQTETFVAAKINIKNARWKGVPFYLKTGKALSEKSAKIVITFKSGPWIKIPNCCGEVDKNILVLRIQPNEGLNILINLGNQTGDMVVSPQLVDFTHKARLGMNTPDAYELLLSEVIEGDRTLFPRWDFIEESWKITDNLRQAIHEPVSYAAGSDGPIEAIHLLQRDGHEWASTSKIVECGKGKHVHADEASVKTSVSPEKKSPRKKPVRAKKKQ